MIVTVHCCKFCQSAQLIRNGSVKGRPKYRCKTCGKSAYFDDRQTPRRQRQAYIETLLTERLSLRAVARLAGVTHTSVARILKKSRLSTTPDPAQPKGGTR